MENEHRVFLAQLEARPVEDDEFELLAASIGNISAEALEYPSNKRALDLASREAHILDPAWPVNEGEVARLYTWPILQQPMTNNAASLAMCIMRATTEGPTSLHVANWRIERLEARSLLNPILRRAIVGRLFEKITNYEDITSFFTNFYIGGSVEPSIDPKFI